MIRNGIPAHAAAYIVTDIIKDLGYAPETHRYMYLDTNSIRR